MATSELPRRHATDSRTSGLVIKGVGEQRVSVRVVQRRIKLDHPEPRETFRGGPDSRPLHSDRSDCQSQYQGVSGRHL